MNSKAELQFHPLADLFPPLQGTAFDDLVADIKVHGLGEPRKAGVRRVATDGAAP